MYIDVQFQVIPVCMFKSQDRLRPVLKSLVVEFSSLVPIAVGGIQLLEIFLIVVMVIVIEGLSR